MGTQVLWLPAVNKVLTSVLFILGYQSLANISECILVGDL